MGGEVRQVWPRYQVPWPGLPPPHPVWRLSSGQGLVPEALGKDLTQQPCLILELAKPDPSPAPSSAAQDLSRPAGRCRAGRQEPQDSSFSEASGLSQGSLSGAPSPGEKSPGEECSPQRSQRWA